MSTQLVTESFVRLRLRGQCVDAAIDVRADEARRRARVGLGPIDHRSLLMVLYGLPAGMAVPMGDLDARALKVLRAAPDGVVELDEARGVLVRRAVPVARVALVLVQGGPTRELVRAASRFGPFCARGVIVPPHVPDLDLVLLKARFFGVGVALPAARGVDWLLMPETYRPQRHTAAQWLFHEQAWRQWGSERPGPHS
ncbi:hypothetical protein ABZY36_03410 [Streptomyces sp. NPDC006627]|uniref:hypothetical protein n=1 Tax=Streptomyces sp. NPDC006627 TaxID=3154679 RepID=UPI0033A0E9EF